MKILICLTTLTCFTTWPAIAQNTGPLGNPPVTIDVSKAIEDPKRLEKIEGRQVALVNIRLNYANGKVNSAELISSRRIDSVAPKVFARQAGEWQVFILGEDTTQSFFVDNPGYLEAEGESEDKPYRYIALEGDVDWPLIVPLYVNGQKIDAKAIRIIDRETEEVIFEAEL